MKSIPYVGIIQIRSRVEGHTFLSACLQAPRIFRCKQKQESPEDASCKKSLCDDFLRRHYPHQVKGRSSVTSSQPAQQAPLYLFVERIIHGESISCNWRSAQKQTPFLANIPNFRFRETETAPCAGQWMRTTQNTDKFVDPRPTAGDFYILGTFDQRSIIGWMESRSKAVCLWEKPCWSRHHTKI